MANGKDDFVTDIEYVQPHAGMPIKKLLELLDSPESVKAMLHEARLPDLQRYVEEIAGQPPHPSASKDFLVAAISRWIDGDENWGDIPERVAHLQKRGKKAKPNGSSTQDAPTETPSAEEDAMNAQKAAAKKSVPPKKEKAEKVKKEGVLPVGKTTGQTRATYILNLLIANRKEKLPDAGLLAKAQKEFSVELVPGTSGTFTIGHQRTVANKDRILGKRDLKKTDAEFVEYGKPEKAVEKKNGKKKASA